MTITVHNPDQYMSALRQIIAQGRKRIGLLIGAGAAAGLRSADGAGPLIPAVAGLTDAVLRNLAPRYGATLDQIKSDIKDANIESILSRVRSLSNVIGATPVYGLDSAGHKALSNAICTQIGEIVNRPLPEAPTPYDEVVNWVIGTAREHPVEIFTTNYDLFFERAFERAHAPYFDGFAGACEAFFDPSSVASNDLPSRWTRLWKIHGSLGWKANSLGEVVRVGEPTATHLVFPEHLKYDQTQKAPYSALFDRLRAFLMTPDTLLIASGFSFGDAHISARIDECLAANPSSSVFAFQYRTLESETFPCKIAARRPNMSVFAPDRAMINSIPAAWKPGDPPTRDWGPIRATYWGPPRPGEAPAFLLGQFDRLTRFFLASRADHALSPTPPAPHSAPPVNSVSTPTTDKPTNGDSTPAGV